MRRNSHGCSQAAAAVIAAVVRSKTPSLFNRIDAKSKLFFRLNRLLPQHLRDEILLRQMDIEV